MDENTTGRDTDEESAEGASDDAREGYPLHTNFWLNADDYAQDADLVNGNLFGGIEPTLDPDAPSYDRSHPYYYIKNCLIYWFVTRHAYEKFLRSPQNDPHDPRWSCAQWPTAVAGVARDVVASYAPTIEISGAPVVILQRYQSDVVYMAWRTPSGGVVCEFRGVFSLEMCDECDPCLVRRGIIAPKGTSLSIVRSPPLVYFIQAGTGGPVKIGRSMNPTERLPTLQTGNPSVLRILATMPGGPVVETSMHALFAKERVRPNGEWFHPSPELLGFIAEIAAHEK